MAVQHSTILTAEEFDAFTLLPENAERLFELIAGEVVQVLSSPHSSAMSVEIAFHMKMYLHQHKVGGHVTGEAGGYVISGERYIPNLAFISKLHQADLPIQGYNPLAPDLAVEIVSPTDTEKQLRIKVANYLAAGTTIWVIYPEAKEAEIYAPGQPVRVLSGEQAIDGGAILPGFSLTLTEIFGSEPEA
jgi:Uma2 family endonuclease